MSGRAALASLSALLALAGTACLGGRLPPLEFYRLALADSTRVATQLDGSQLRLALAPGSIAIAPYQTPGIYADRSIVYRIGDTQYGAYPSREWALPLSTMLGLVTQDVLRAHPVTAEPAVFEPPAYTSQTYVWRGLVREFEEVDRDSRVFAAVHLEARLVRAADDSVLWAGSVRLEEPVPEGTMPAIVGALSRISADAVGQLADQARAALGRAASAGR